MRIKELDGLRGIAVLAVLSDHYMSWLPAIGSQYGWLGVDLFFVLSGFLITSILLELRDKEHYFKVFYARRALRIFPPYFLGIFVYLFISFALNKPGTWELWLQYVFYYTSLFVGQPPQLHATPPVIPFIVSLGLAVLWSLSVEEIYYTIWAPVVRYTTQKGFTAILVAMILSAPLLRWWLHTPQFPETYTFYCRMDGLAYGSVVALLIRDRRLAPERWLTTDKWFDRASFIVLPVTAALWLITRGDKSNVLVVTLGLILADMSFALIAHALIRRSGGEQLWVRAFRARWLRSIGMVSYSLYLFHYPLRALSIDLVTRLHLSRHADAIASVLLGLALSLGVAYGLWYGMESRILLWKDRKVPSPAHPEIPQALSR
jgi:peptidoglycan/LPS O-acetylase OafA/YrhL